MDEYERVLLVKNDVQAFKIPPKTTARAYRASDWSLDAPDWNCRLRLISIGKKCYLKLDEKNTGQFFGQCPIETYPSDSIEPVSDSSRYFVVKLVNEQTGRAAFLGIGFIDRSDSFDLNVTLQDHFKIMKNEEDGEDSKESTAPKLDLGFKEGQTIKVNLNLKKKSLANKPKGALGLGSGGILLPPPPSGSSKTTTTSTLSSSSSSSSALNSDPFSGQFENLSVDNKPETSTDNAKETKNIDLLFDFGSFESSPAPSSTTNIPSTIASSTNQQANWANFD